MLFCLVFFFSFLFNSSSTYSFFYSPNIFLLTNGWLGLINIAWIAKKQKSVSWLTIWYRNRLIKNLIGLMAIVWEEYSCHTNRTIWKHRTTHRFQFGNNYFGDRQSHDCARNAYFAYAVLGIIDMEMLCRWTAWALRRGQFSVCYNIQIHVWLCFLRSVCSVQCVWWPLLWLLSSASDQLHNIIQIYAICFIFSTMLNPIWRRCTVLGTSANTRTVIQRKLKRNVLITDKTKDIRSADVPISGVIQISNGKQSMLYIFCLSSASTSIVFLCA